MDEPLVRWLAWGGLTLALLAFAYVIHRVLDWIERRLR